MSGKANNVQVETLPVAGYSLIEASAGTGKTFTLSHLYLRLILQAEPNIKDSPMTVKQILVVTFTNAATVELKTRIRKILQQAQKALQTPDNSEPLLQAIVAKAVAEKGQDAVQQLLRQALLAMDEAAIFTIHGFCQKVLKSYRFFTQSAGQLELLQDQSELLQTVTAEIWRKHFYNIDKTEADVLLSLAKTPNALAQMLSSTLQHELALQEQAFSHIPMFKRHLSQAQTRWQQEQQAIKAKFAAKGLGRSYTARNLPGLYAELDELLVAQQPYQFLKGSKLSFLRQSVVDEKTAGAKNTIAFSLFETLDALFDCMDEIDQQLLAFCRSQCQQALAEQKAQLGLLSFDDLIVHLQLLLAQGSPRSHLLSQQIRQDYPVALIDEFQDTDSKQLAIFTRIYPNQSGCGLLFIGDPKQAIYSFRGGDIHSYFLAKQQVANDKCYTLATNYRSLRQLVENINVLFSLQPQAFVAEDFGQFVHVDAHNDDASQRLHIDGKPTSFSVLSLDKTQNTSPVLQQQAAEQTTEFIAGLLQGNATLKQQAIKPNQIAVLVRSNKQARLMQKKLAQKGLNSIFLSRDSVLASEQFGQMQIILQAVMNALDNEAVSSALVLPCMGLTANALQVLQNDPGQFFEQQNKFITAQSLWQSQGFMPMWQYLNQAFSMAENLLLQQAGERKLSNFNQIAEIFQKQCAIYKQPAQQLQHFLRLQAASDSDEQSMRLESESHLIEIVTMHRSKGLEYDVVCCPFLFVGPAPDRSRFVRTYQPGEAGFSYLPKEQASQRVLEQAKKDAFAEEIRILYVALTRAKYHLNMTFDYVKGVDKSALWHVLYGQHNTMKTIDYADFTAVFKEFKGFVQDPVIAASKAGKQADMHVLLPALEFTRKVKPDFVARSYSALVRNLHSESNKEVGLEQEVFIQSTKQEDSIFTFHKGARAGNFMHDVFECSAFDASDAELQETVAWALEKYQFSNKPWQTVLTKHFVSCLQAKLDGDSLSLSVLDKSQVKKEMAFSLYARPSQGEHIAQILSRYRGGSSAFSLQNIAGMFIGFIDLLFQYQGKFYVLDYKSNYLGDTVEDYLPEALQQSIEEHNYDLQYLIYLAALQRYLKTRLSDYDYQQHVGGVYYLYLRGLGHGIENAGVYYAKPPASIVDAVEALFQKGVYE